MPSASRLLGFASLLVLVATAACTGEVKSGDARSGNLRIVLHDGPSPDVDEVWITFDRISVRPEEGGWIVVDETVRTVDLESLTGGVDATLAIADIPPGLYSEIRLHIIEAHVVIDGVEHDLDIPSGDTSGLELKASFEVPECGTVQVSLDWDLSAHLHCHHGHGFDHHGHGCDHHSRGHGHGHGKGHGHGHGPRDSDGDGDSDGDSEGLGCTLRPTLRVDVAIEDSACCEDPPCVRLGNCLVTPREVEADREVAAAVAAGRCAVVDELPPSTPQTRPYPPSSMPRIPGEEGAPHPRAGDDGDADGIPDGTEMALARRFFPNLNMHFGTYEGTPNADRSQYYGDATFGPGVSGHLAFAARVWGGGDWEECRNGANQCIEIRYTLAYNYDLGDDVFGGGHRGDSEFYAVLLQRDAGTSWVDARDEPGAWHLIMDFMAAHKCATQFGISVDGSRFRWRGQQGGPSSLWVAEGKHGSYPSQDSCNAGGETLDDCSDNRQWVPRGAATAELSNAGMPAIPIDPYIPYPGSCPMCGPAGSYNVWERGAPFGISSAYGQHMQGCLWWDSFSFGCGVCPYEGTAGEGEGCAATGDACGQAPSGCFCDENCITMGDCCPDACTVCGTCPHVCGDGICEGTEDACCPDDCPAVCGDGVCSSDEDCTSCPGDCPDCGPDPANCGQCAATGGTCGQAPSGCWCDANCVDFRDCCPDSCDACGVCPPDCGDGMCAPWVEDNCSCPADCPPVCGNGMCDCEESSATCPSECGCTATGGACGLAPNGCACDPGCVARHDCCADSCDTCGSCDPCGNGVCAPFVEDACTCPADCPPVCGNGACDCGETDWSCPFDCGCSATHHSCGAAPNGCKCDPVCGLYGDCCSDACLACGSCDSVPPGLSCGDGFCTPFLEDNCSCPADCPPVCGNGMCDCQENCDTCPAECGACAVTCGNGTCDLGVEDCATCPSECPCAPGSSCSAGVCVAIPTPCGNGACDSGENCATCPGDCGTCPAGCGDGACAPFIEDNCVCPLDCPPVCGNGMCDCEESCATCPSECGSCGGPGCGDGICAPFVEDNCNCPGDCPPVCGNGTCDCEESCATCPSECGSCGGVCGDGSCDGGEDCSTCPADCGSCGVVCGDGVCTPVVEGCGNCPGDCPCWMPGTTCIGGVCATYCGNGTCEPFVEDNCNCPGDCPPVCGNGMCDCAEDCITCPSECGSCGPDCGDGSCDFPENCISCSADCGSCFP